MRRQSQIIIVPGARKILWGGIVKDVLFYLLFTHIKVNFRRGPDIFREGPVAEGLVVGYWNFTKLFLYSSVRPVIARC